VVSSTVKAATLVAAGQETAAACSLRVATLTEGVVKAMFVNKLKAALTVCLVAGLVLLGSVFSYGTKAADRNPAPLPPPSEDRLADTLILLDKQWWEAASKHDVDTLSKILADDWVGGNSNKAACLEHYRHARYVDVKFLTERRVVRIDQHTAMMSYELNWRAEDKTIKLTPESVGHDRVIHCWVQRDGGWFVKCTERVNLMGATDFTAPVPPPGPVPVQPMTPADLLFPWGVNPRFSTPGPPLAMATPWKAGVRASSFDGVNSPEMAFDGSRETMWNSGMYAPGWIEKDLGEKTSLAGIVLHPSQTPEGETVNEVWVSDEPIGNDRTKAKLGHTFKGFTKNAEPLRYDFPKDKSARYVQIRTTDSPSWIGWWEVEILVKVKAR
jgi:hypothetical protein